MFSVSAINRSEILLSAVVFMAAVWGIVHIPGANLQMIIFTCLLSGLLAGSGSSGDRLKKASLCACYGAVIQFIFSVSGNLPLIVLSTLLLLCAVYWLYWHLCPFTDNAFVFANTRPVSPWTAGYITGIFVKNNQFVSKGAPLFSIFAPPYLLKASELEHEKESLAAKL